MLQASKQYPERLKNINVIQDKKRIETIIYRAKDIVKYNEDGSRTIKTEYQPINLTVRTNETAKLVKNQTAAQKLAEMEKILSK